MKIKNDNKTFLKILSAFAAIVLWFAITYTEDPVITQYLADIDIVFEGEDLLLSNGLVVVNKESLPSISVTIRGTRSAVISSLNSISAQVDVSGISAAGTNTVKIKYNYPSSSVTLYKAKTNELSVQTENIIAREIPVKAESQYEDKNSEFLVKSTLADDTIKVRGASSTVYSISYAKVIVDADAVSKTSSQEYFYKFYDENDDIVSESNITHKSSPTIAVYNEVYLRKTLPVKVVLNEEMAKDNVLTVRQQSIDAVVAGLSENCTAGELFAYLDPDKKNGDVYELTIDVPDGCYLPEESFNLTADCVLAPKVQKNVEVLVSIENVPEGKNIKIAPERITVSLKGTEDSLSKAELKAKVDASSMDGGAKDLEVIIEAQENIEVIGSYKVSAIVE